MFGFPVPYLPKAQQKGVWFRPAPKTTASFFPLEPYTCGACGIQFQFYNNLLEHMQSHAGKGLSGPQGMLQPSPFPFLRPCKRQDGRASLRPPPEEAILSQEMVTGHGACPQGALVNQLYYEGRGLCSGETAGSVGAQRVGMELKKASRKLWLLC